MQGVFDARISALSLLLGAAVLHRDRGGAYFFRGASDQLYRRVAYAIIVAAARGQPAAVRSPGCVESLRAIFAISASDTSKLA